MRQKRVSAFFIPDAYPSLILVFQMLNLVLIKYVVEHISGLAVLLSPVIKLKVLRKKGEQLCYCKYFISCFFIL